VCFITGEVVSFLETAVRAPINAPFANSLVRATSVRAVVITRLVVVVGVGVTVVVVVGARGHVAKSRP
jgi:hypothetical protein